ncbi:MAG: XRE family transcriptional regulator [Alphaproteobacteria bacterium PA4]|nr:MAG: XRE family transcriptional regulator [Alphaproteobacteria bacterium PA4]
MRCNKGGSGGLACRRQRVQPRLCDGRADVGAIRGAFPLTPATATGIEAAVRPGTRGRASRAGPGRREDPNVDMADGGLRRTGAMLAEARAASGLTLEEIAKDTRVPLRHLRALEADQHDALPALPYAIGFVKSFARAVKLNPEEVAGQFRAETSKQPHQPMAASMEPLDERRVPGRSLVGASVAVIVLVIAGLSAWGAGVFDPAPVATSVETTVAPPVEAPAPDPAPLASDGSAVAAVAAPAAPGAIAAPVSAGGAVVLTAKEDVWIKIYDRDTRTSARIGILKAGESYTVPADQPGLLLWTGKAGALAVTVGGRALPPLGGPVQTVRDISLTAADLIARSQPAPPAAPPVAPATAPATTPAAPTPGV